MVVEEYLPGPAEGPEPGADNVPQLVERDSRKEMRGLRHPRRLQKHQREVGGVGVGAVWHRAAAVDRQCRGLVGACIRDIGCGVEVVDRVPGLVDRSGDTRFALVEVAVPTVNFKSSETVVTL